MIEKLSPTLEMALQNELREAYLKGIETGYKRAKKEMSEFIVLPPAVAYEVQSVAYGNIKESASSLTGRETL